jgi:uncharacterized membrane protein YfcA
MLAPIIIDPAFYALAIPAVIFLGLAKGGFSGVATGATPLLALYLPPLEAAALLLPIVLCQDAISVHTYWRDWSGWNLKILLPGAVFGLVLGYLFAAHVSDDTIRILIGLTALIFVANTWLGATRPKQAQSGIAAGLFWGTVAGFLSFASQGGGPPFQVFTLPQRLSKMTFVGTTAIFFAALNIIKIVPYAMLAQFTRKECLNLPRSPAPGGFRESRRNLADQSCANGAILSHYLCFVVCTRIGPVLPRRCAHAWRKRTSTGICGRFVRIR